MRKRISTLVATAALATLALAGPAGAVAPAHAPAGAKGTVTAARSQADQVLSAPATLERGRSWTSDTAQLVMQTDGNLVIYDEFGNARWASNTVGSGWLAAFQTDGNFVVYTRSGHPVWASNTAGHPGSRLVVQNDGNVVIYDGSQAVWASGTNH
ncbi:hypothetical protein AB0A70_18205 [Streptomyces morookaense]|uniref:hypothetical protein n=1 Tax=Streptomyces morookaense TaxID=1970 RepID=UPI0033EEC83E